MHQYFSVSLLSSSLGTLFPLTCCWQITLFIHKVKHWEKSMALGKGWILLKLFWPFQIKALHVSFPPAQHNTLYLTSVLLGWVLLQAQNFGLCSWTWGVRDSQGHIQRPTVSVETPQHRMDHKEWPGDRFQEVTAQCQRGRGTQHPDLREPQFPHHYLEVSQLGCTGKGQCKFRGLLQISPWGWSLMGKYHNFFL